MHLFTAPPPIKVTRHRISKQPTPCASCGDIGSATSAAVTAFNNMNQSCVSASAAVQAANFGPFPIGSDCTYDCCDSMQFTWSWNPDYGDWAKPSLSQAITFINWSSNYFEINNQLQSWLTTTLPASGQSILATINSIIQVEQAIIAAGGVTTPEQQQQLITLFNNANSYTVNVQTQVMCWEPSCSIECLAH